MLRNTLKMYFRKIKAPLSFNEEEVSKMLNLDPRVLGQWRDRRMNLSYGEGENGVFYDSTDVIWLLKECLRNPHFPRASSWIQGCIQRGMSSMQRLFVFPSLFYYAYKKESLSVTPFLHVSLLEKDWKYIPPQEDEED